MRIDRVLPVADVVSRIHHDLAPLSASSVSAVREVRRRHAKELAQQDAPTIMAVATALFDAGTWPARLVACELVNGRRDVRQRLSVAMVERWAKGLADWGSIDLYGVTVAGVAWREARIQDERVMRWAHSDDRWRRRLALVSTVPLNSRARGGNGDATRTLAICRTLIDDRDDMVVKALSWALRELAKRDRESVRRFMRKEDARLASRVRREVTSKLETGYKVRPRPKRAKMSQTPVRTTR